MKKYVAYILYALIAGLIMRPFFQPGFLFLLDMSWTPHIQLSDYLSGGVNAGFVLTLLIKLLSFLLPVPVIQKFILFLIFFLSGVFMYRFARFNELGREWAFASGLFYMVNPWMYERFLAGHWLVMLGYVFFPLAVSLLFELFKNPGKQASVKLGLLLAIYPLFSLHWAYITYLFLTFCGLVFLWKNKQFRILKTPSFVKGFFFILLGVLTVNSFWLFSFWGEESVWPKISFNDFKTFTTSADPVFGSFFNTLSLYGYWQDIYFLPKDFFALWWLVSLLVLCLSVYGFVAMYKEKKIFGYIASLIFLPILLVAVGLANQLTGKLVELLFCILPGFKGLRETAKLTGVIVFFLAFFYAFGARGLVRLAIFDVKDRQKKILNNTAVGLIILLPFLMSYGMFFAFNSQVKTYQYPKGWQVVEEMLRNDVSVQDVLFLPWHGYPTLNFAGNKKIANPAKNYFSFPVVQGRNLDNVFLLETEQGEWDRYMTSIVQGMENLDDMRSFLDDKGISHVILAKIDDYERYGFLEDSKVLDKIYEDADIILYKLK